MGMLLSGQVQERTMNKATFWIFRTTASQYALLGFFAGLLIVILATLIELARHRIPLETASFVRVHQSNALFWLIDLTPLLLGLFGAVAGRGQDALRMQNKALMIRETE